MAYHALSSTLPKPELARTNQALLDHKESALKIGIVASVRHRQNTNSHADEQSQNLRGPAPAAEPSHHNESRPTRTQKAAADARDGPAARAPPAAAAAPARADAPTSGCAV